MYLYVYKGYTGGREGQKRTEELIHRALELYLAEEKTCKGSHSPSEKEQSGLKEFSLEVLSPKGRKPEIQRGDKGKPYFKDLPVEFSVSHTGTLWVCAMDQSPVGVDIQEIRTDSGEKAENRFKKIMERYYTGEEKAYVQEAGTDGFFQIWARKEAYGKYLGTGLSEEVQRFSTLFEGRFSTLVEGRFSTPAQIDVTFVDLDLCDGVKGSCCMKGTKELWIRKLL